MCRDGETENSPTVFRIFERDLRERPPIRPLEGHTRGSSLPRISLNSREGSIMVFYVGFFSSLAIMRAIRDEEE